MPDVYLTPEESQAEFKKTEAAYFMSRYGTCTAKPNGSPNCGGDCYECFGANWRPMGARNFTELLELWKKTHTKEML